MTPEDKYQGIRLLSEYPGQNDPHGQLDKSMCKILKELIGKSEEEVCAGLLRVLNESCYGSLASDFMMKILATEYFIWSGKNWSPKIVVETLTPKP